MQWLEIGIGSLALPLILLCDFAPALSAANVSLRETTSEK
jgi:hypothetical protein